MIYTHSLGLRVFLILMYQNTKPPRVTRTSRVTENITQGISSCSREPALSKTKSESKKKSLFQWRTRRGAEPVSYTHLDVYKRQGRKK